MAERVVHIDEVAGSNPALPINPIPFPENKGQFNNIHILIQIIMEKIFGWILLTLGVLIILWGVWNSYQIFNVQKSVPEIFSIEESLITDQTPEEGSQASQEIQRIIKEQIGQLFPPGFISKILNLFSWSIFMFILITAGGKMSILGIKLIK